MWKSYELLHVFVVTCSIATFVESIPKRFRRPAFTARKAPVLVLKTDQISRLKPLDFNWSFYTFAFEKSKNQECCCTQATSKPNCLNFNVNDCQSSRLNRIFGRNFNWASFSCFWRCSTCYPRGFFSSKLAGRNPRVIYILSWFTECCRYWSLLVVSINRWLQPVS